MSQHNVERYRRSIDAWNRGARDEWLEDVTPGVGVRPLRGLSRPRPDLRIEDLGETVLALATIHATGKRSGDQHTRNYASWDDALEAVELRE